MQRRGDEWWGEEGIMERGSKEREMVVIVRRREFRGMESERLIGRKE